MDVSDFDFELPESLIAQRPPDVRGTSRLLVLDRRTGGVVHSSIDRLPGFLTPGDVVALNNTRVFPARLLGSRVPSGGGVECLLLQRLDADRWEALVHPGQKLKPGARVRFGEGAHRIEGEILERRFYGRRVLRLWLERPPEGHQDATAGHAAAGPSAIDRAIDAIGHVPLPPYIKRPDTDTDRERYQTVYATVRGSVAAPTAGLHLTEHLLQRLEEKGIAPVPITLHVGYGTFKPVRSERVEDHTVDPERFEISAEAAALLSRALQEGRRVVGVGTTTVRALESAVRGRTIVAGPGTTSLFIHPGHRFGAVGGLLTNFHLPRSSLLMLVCAFGGTERVLAAYREAIARQYRFYSYGDAMLIL